MQQPPSFTGGDPYGTASRTEDVNWHARKRYVSAFKKPKFRRHDPSKVVDKYAKRYDHDPVLLPEQEDAFTEAVNEHYPGGTAEHVMKSIAIRQSVQDHLQREAARDYDGSARSARDSYNDTQRRRKMAVVNQAVAQQVPARPPFQRSFIPQDLWHMLSPNE